jgi:hypothetical protein
MDQTENTNDMVNATDCLEAVGVFKSMKNIFFLLTCFSLIFLQIAFWLNHVGCIDKSRSKYAEKTVSASAVCPPGPFAKHAPQGFNVPTGPASLVAPKVPVEPDAEDTAEAKIDKLVKDADKLSKKTAEAKAPPAVTKAPRNRIEPPEDVNIFVEMFVPEVPQVTALIRTCNFILIISAAMYCLTMLVSVKISLAGRLGGINHISRAFFRSLFAFVLLMPWQLSTDGVVTGAVYTPEELFAPTGLIAQPTWLGHAFYYLRFTGLWAVVFVLLIAAQFSSKKWSKATLRRLGIAH